MIQQIKRCAAGQKDITAAPIEFYAWRAQQLHEWREANPDWEARERERLESLARLQAPLFPRLHRFILAGCFWAGFWYSRCERLVVIPFHQLLSKLGGRPRKEEEAPTWTHLDTLLWGVALGLLIGKLIR